MAMEAGGSSLNESLLESVPELRELDSSADMRPPSCRSLNQSLLTRPQAMPELHQLDSSADKRPLPQLLSPLSALSPIAPPGGGMSAGPSFPPQHGSPQGLLHKQHTYHLPHRLHG